MVNSYRYEKITSEEVKKWRKNISLTVRKSRSAE